MLQLLLLALLEPLASLGLPRLAPKRAPGSLILVRHGTTPQDWAYTFTGWADVNINARGRREMEHAARLLLESGYAASTAPSHPRAHRVRTPARTVFALPRAASALAAFGRAASRSRLSRAPQGRPARIGGRATLHVRATAVGGGLRVALRARALPCGPPREL